MQRPLHCPVNPKLFWILDSFTRSPFFIWQTKIWPRGRVDFGFWILQSLQSLDFAVCRDIETRLALRAWNTCIIVQNFFSRERPEVHEKDADSFMAFIKRWLFGGHFVVDFCPVWKICAARFGAASRLGSLEFFWLILRDEWLGICRNYAKSQMRLGHKMLLNEKINCQEVDWC